MPDILDGCIRIHIADHGKVVFKFADSLQHISLVLIKSFHIFQIDFCPRKNISADVSFRPVNQPEHISPLHNSFFAEIYRRIDIGNDILRNKMVIQIRNNIFHAEWDIMLHQFFKQCPRICIGAVQHRHVLIGQSLCN